jgi:hypothetical protein
VTTLSDDGVPTPVVHTRLRAPASRIGPADDVDGAAKASPLYAKYGTRVEAESARERLATRMDKAAVDAEPTADRPRSRRRKKAAPIPAPSGGVDVLGDFLTSREGKAMQRTVLRGVFGMLRKRL